MLHTVLFFPLFLILTLTCTVCPIVATAGEISLFGINNPSLRPIAQFKLEEMMTSMRRSKIIADECFFWSSISYQSKCGIVRYNILLPYGNISEFEIVWYASG